MNKPTNIKLAGNSPASRDVAFHMHPYTNPAQLAATGPHIMSQGDGVFVYDDSGNRFYEGMSGLWCTSLGFSEVELVNAAVAQLNRLPFYHSFAGKRVDPAIELAETLIPNAPPAGSGSHMSKVFFAASGSEANDTAMKMVWYYNAALGRPEKRKIISRKKGYHGVTMAAASMTALAYAQDGFGLPLDFVKHTTAPDYYNGAQKGETEEEFASRCAAELEELILAEGPDTVAALFAEPVMGAGGVIIPPAGYFAKIRAVIEKYDVLLVADEVICGFGRTGNMWGSQTMDVRPDMLTCAKALSSAYLPISAVMMSDKVYAPLAEQAEKLGIFGNGYTYSAHPLACAAALATLDVFAEDDLFNRGEALAPVWEDAIHGLKGLPNVIDIRNLGMMGAVELVPREGAPTTRAYDVFLKCYEKGLLVRQTGDIIAMSPPLIATEEQLGEIMSILAEAISETE